jgi:hypothetical protein
MKGKEKGRAFSFLLYGCNVFILKIYYIMCRKMVFESKCVNPGFIILRNGSRPDFLTY